MKIFNLKQVYITLSLTALGLVLGSIVSFLKLPIYLDTLGIMLATLLLGWRYGILCAVLTAALAFFIVSPYVPFYFPTMLGVVFVTEWMYKQGMYATLPKTTIAGIIHGIVGTAISAPITYFLFDGFTSSGNDVIVSFFQTQGINLFVSIVLSLTIFAIIDRVLTAWFSFSISKALPKKFYTKNGLRNTQSNEV
jgi:energy-coupling factor transport system substrate-specific component